MWKSDGTEAGARRIAPVKVEADPLQPLCVWDGSVYFAGYDPNTGIELWTSNGTDTHIVKDIMPGPDSSLIPNLTALPSGVAFSTTTDPNQAALWLTDGTEENTNAWRTSPPATRAPCVCTRCAAS